jgi:hypothetical protein
VEEEARVKEEEWEAEEESHDPIAVRVLVLNDSAARFPFSPATTARPRVRPEDMNRHDTRRNSTRDRRV